MQDQSLIMTMQKLGGQLPQSHRFPALEKQICSFILGQQTKSECEVPAVNIKVHATGFQQLLFSIPSNLFLYKPRTTIVLGAVQYSERPGAKGPGSSVELRETCFYLFTISESL